jgi:hypothetical protein
VSFASEPGRDDGNLPPVNIVVPDDARELDRDVLAYHREQRARRRRRRIMRLFRPFWVRDAGGQAAVIPLIAACLAISLVGGALLSVVTMGPALAPTVSGRQSATPTVAPPAAFSTLPSGSIQLNGRTAAVHSLVNSVIALIPAGCRCDAKLSRLSRQAVTAHVSRVYFAGSGPVAAELTGYTSNDGDGVAGAAVDNGNVLGAAYDPGSQLTVLLVYKDATVRVIRGLSDTFQLTSAIGELAPAGASPSPAHTPVH